MSMPALLSRPRERAYVLVEMLMALSVFGMCAVALIKALAATTKLAVESQMDARMLLRLQSRLTEISKLRDISAWKDQSVTSQPDELGVWTETLVEEMPEILNVDGQQVTQLYRIYVKAFNKVEWKNEPDTMDAEVWRYLPLYRTVNSGQ
jgi:type II secretory pathway pseudopilin PulG